MSAVISLELDKHGWGGPNKSDWCSIVKSRQLGLIISVFWFLLLPCFLGFLFLWNIRYTFQSINCEMNSKHKTNYMLNLKRTNIRRLNIEDFIPGELSWGLLKGIKGGIHASTIEFYSDIADWQTFPGENLKFSSAQ